MGVSVAGPRGGIGVRLLSDGVRGEGSKPPREKPLDGGGG